MKAIGEAKDYFERESERPGTSPDYQRQINCFAVTCGWLEATAARMLGNSKVAKENLRTARKRLGSCQACLGEVERAEALLWADLVYRARILGDHHTARVTLARSHLAEANRIHLKIGNGHNLNHNAWASCLLTEAQIFYAEGSWADAIPIYKKLLEQVDPTQSPKIFWYAMKNLAVCIIEGSDESQYEVAESLLDEAARQFWRQSEVTQEKMGLCWMRGMLKGRLGKGRSESLLEKAQSMAIKLNLEFEVVMISSDIVRFHLLNDRSFWLVRTSLSCLQHRNGDWRAIVPSPMRGQLSRILRLADEKRFSDLWVATEQLRETGSDSTTIPCLLPKIEVLG